MGVGTMFSIQTWRDVREFFKAQVPSVFLTGRFNFITIHYCYIGGMAIFLSIVVYAIGNIPYIDALFLASGSCTQSGLNTIDINKIATGQQAMLYMGAMFCNPIVIHGSVVFVRLYWFEKRFEDVVKEARAIRRTKSRARDPTIPRTDLEQGDPEINIRDRAISVMRRTGRRLSMKAPDDDQQQGKSDKKEFEPSSNSPTMERQRRQERPLRHVNSANSLDEMRLPIRFNTEQHIRFLENQRNPQDDVTLRIPSPREFDRGGRPRNIGEQTTEDLQRSTMRLQHDGGVDNNQDIDKIDYGDDDNNKNTVDDNGDEGTMRQPNQIATHLTFNEPEIHRDRPRTGNLPPRLNQKRSGTGVSRMSAATTQPLGEPPTSGLRRSNTARTAESMPYLSYQATVGRNSFFVNLTEEQREELGGIEYRALKTLALMLLFYFFAFHLLAIVCLTLWIWTTSFGSIVTEDGQGRTWWGIFTAGSAFNDLGFTLTPDSMNSFSHGTFVLLIMTYLIIIGNTGFPCMLRFMIWLLSKTVAVGGGLWEELQFLLDHPRRCFTLLFPRSATWWLFAILILLNGVDLLFFVILDLKNTAVTELSGWYKFLDGLFQAASTRTAGFSVVNLAALHPAIQVSYLIMMYISVFPIAISMRRTNVYEEKSLGIYAPQNDEEIDDESKEPSYVGAHLRKQLSFDLWYIFLGLFIIAIVEGDRLENTNEYAFTLFSVLFEIVSAYGTVGLSLGYPTINASFSAEFRVISKLVIIAMQIRGRHRGLPYELDRAVLLPSESLHETERKQAERLLSRRPSLARSTASAVGGDLESEKFRSETGLSSGFDTSNSSIMLHERRSTNRSLNSNTSGGEHHAHLGPARRELGNALFRLATAPDAIKEEVTGRSSSSGS